MVFARHEVFLAEGARIKAEAKVKQVRQVYEFIQKDKQFYLTKIKD